MEDNLCSRCGGHNRTHGDGGSCVAICLALNFAIMGQSNTFQSSQGKSTGTTRRTVSIEASTWVPSHTRKLRCSFWIVPTPNHNHRISNAANERITRKNTALGLSWLQKPHSILLLTMNWSVHSSQKYCVVCRDVMRHGCPLEGEK